MAKRSRRERKQETDKRQSQADIPQQARVAPVVVAQPVPVEAPAEPAPGLARKAVDFAQEYYYVYTDLRNVTIIAVVMFALMFGLGFLF